MYGIAPSATQRDYLHANESGVKSHSHSNHVTRKIMGRVTTRGSVHVQFVSPRPRRAYSRLHDRCRRHCIGTRARPAKAGDQSFHLTLPVFNPLVWNIMKARGFDTKNGFELDAKAYPSISAFYAAFATGETDVLIGGPTILQKLYREGVPVRIIGTGFTLADLVIFTKNDKIKSLADMKGKQLAVDMGGSQFQVTKMYTAAKGLDLGRDIIVVNANFAVA